MRETAFDKARRLLTEGRLTVHAIGGRSISAVCRGDSAKIYNVGWANGAWYCTCAATGRCSHCLALMLVTLEPD